MGGAGPARRCDDRGYFVVGEPGDDGGHEDDHRNAGVREPRHGIEAPLRLTGARLQHPAQRGVDGGQRYAHRGEPLPRQLRQQVDIARHQVVLGDHLHRVARLAQHLQAAAGEAQAALDRLVGIGHPAQPKRLRPPAGPCQLLAQQLGSVLLDQDPGLEVQPRGHAQVLVRGPREAVGAAVLAAPVGVDGGVEVHVGAVVVSDDAARAVAQQLGARALRRRAGVRLRLQRLGIGQIVDAVEAVAGIGHRAASPHHAPAHAVPLSTARPPRGAAAAPPANSVAACSTARQ